MPAEAQVRPASADAYATAILDLARDDVPWADGMFEQLICTAWAGHVDS